MEIDKKVVVATAAGVILAGLIIYALKNYGAKIPVVGETVAKIGEAAKG